MSNRKKIGIVGYLVEGMFGVGLAYMNYFSKFGDVSIINHTEREIRRDLDLLVIPGGPDVDPGRYLEDDDILDLKVGKPCIIRERFDEVLLPKYIENKTPILGICRAHQSIAVYFGSKLVQHMKHEENPTYDREKLVHNILIDSREVSKFIGIESHKIPTIQKVNSIHHQVVKDVPEDAVCIAKYQGVEGPQYIEALLYPNHNIATVQFHPEEINDILSRSLIVELLKRSNAEK